MVKNYIPKQGDVVFYEQTGKRLAVVISTTIFYQHTKMVIVCPITSNTKEFPTHYKLEETKCVYGSVLCEHVRNIDYEIRNLKFVEKLSDKDLLSVIALFHVCIEE